MPAATTLSRATLADAVEHLRARDPRLGDWIDRIGDVGLRRQPHRFGALCRSILSQQLAAAAAKTIHARFLARFAPERTVSPAALLRLPDAELRACGISERKVGYLRALARAFDDGPLARARFGAMADEEVIERLVELPGVGRWTAEMFLIFSLGRPDVFAKGDLALREGVRRVTRARAPLAPDAAARRAARWSPWRSVASLYLWRIAHWSPPDAT